jgi:ATP-dependent helicase/DNAse subunit B
VLIADPLQIRARRFRAVFATGLQDGEFPRRPTPDPFLDDDDRRALARASGLVLALGEDVLAADRYLFYATCSRPEELLALSWRSSSEEGDPLQASPFVEDVRLLFDSSLWEARRRRLLAEVTWAPDDAPTPLERRRALAAARREPEPSALAPPASEAVLAALAARDHESARGLETFSACGVRWVVDFMLRPRAIDPDPDPLWRGSLAHAVLETTLRRLKETTGSARLTPDSLPAALAELDAALGEADARARSAAQSAALRAVRANLVRYLRLECEQGPALEPAALEWTFGRDDDGPGPLVLDDETRVSGRIDRVDVGDGKAIVRDYKLSTAYAAARWNEKRSLQAGLYALAVRALMGLEPVAALYQPLSGRELRPRGIVRAGVDGSYVGPDVLDDDAFEAALCEVRELAVEAAADIRSGRVAPCPSRCSTRGCMYPGICRAPAVETQPDSPNGEDAP